MEGQMSLFPDEQKNFPKTRKRERKEGKCLDPSQSFDESMKRFWHYMETKGMNERWIETAVGELRIIIEALADYYDIAGRNVSNMSGYQKAVWEVRLERIKQIQTRLEDSTGYSRDGQLEKCMRQRGKKDDDIGEDALVMALKRKM